MWRRKPLSEQASGNLKDASDTAEAYYDSADADRFYFAIWGGEDIHVGIYESAGQPVSEASRRTIERMAGMMHEPGSRVERVIDLGAGYGGAARWLVRQANVDHVTCVNISDTQNELNRQKNEAAGIARHIEVKHGSFDDVPAEDGAFDVVWSQDAFLHGADRQQILAEAWRLLKPGGRLIFTDIMQTPDAPAEALQPVYDRIHLASLGSIAFYDKTALALGFRSGPRAEMAGQLISHYGTVRHNLIERRDELKDQVSEDYIDRMIDGLKVWVDSAGNGWLTWGILTYDKPKG